MTDTAPKPPPPADAGRRRFILGGAGGLTIGVAALALPGCAANVATIDHPTEKSDDDSALLNNVLGVEYQAIAAYDAVLAGTTLTAAERDLATAFRADHLKHAEVIAASIKRSGGTPPERSPNDQPFAATEVGSRSDALRFLIGIEQGLSLAHLSAVPAFTSKGLAKGAAGICSVESMHWAIWRNTLGEEPVPAPVIG
jgi:Ferritin-like domain